MKARERGGGRAVLPAKPMGGVSSRAGMSLRWVIGRQECGRGRDCGPGPRGAAAGTLRQ